MSVPKKRRINVAVACNPCRAKKAACDGRRPRCRRCGSTNNECNYDTSAPDETRTVALKRENELLRQRQAEIDHLLSRLKSLPDHDSIELLRQLRTGRNPLAIPSPVDTYQVSEHETARAALPSTNSRLEYELAVSHSSSYPSRSATSSQDFSMQSSSKFNGLPSPSFGPSEAPRYIDSRLGRLAISYWTNVPVSNEYAALAISLYLETDHPVLGLFDADLFIADLVGNRLNFCSPLLVNSVLFWACQMYSGIDRQASLFCPEFLREAERLWKSSYRKDSFLSAAALHLLSLGCTGVGDDQLGTQFEKEGGQMAERLGLIGVPSNALASDQRALPELKRALSHTAWGIFNYLMYISLCKHPPRSTLTSALRLRSIHFRESVVKYPPNLPIPGKQYPDPSIPLPHPLPQYMGDTFPLLCDFWLIVQEFALYYYANAEFGIPLQDRVPLAVAESIYQKLLGWADTASISVADGKSEPHHLAILQIWYHTVIMDVFRPFKGQDLNLTTFSYAESTPEDIIRASLNQLKRHVVTFPSRHSAAGYAIFWHIACMYVANAALEDIADPEWRRYFDLCTRAYQKFSTSFRFATTVLQGLLHMAMRKGVLTLDESKGIIDKSWKNGSHWIGVSKSTSTYKVDLDLAMTSPEAADIASMVQNFNDDLQINDGQNFMDNERGVVLGESDGLMLDDFTTLFGH